MLFYGPPGTGKTSTILALAHDIYGPLLFRTRVLELNASDERGITIVRNKIKDFARTQLSNPPSGPQGVDYLKRYPCPPYKIIILDEADSMTQDAQSALRRTMETYSRITRFALVCNYVTRIIDPLASRCSKFRFKSLDQSNAKRRLEEIAKAEGVNMEVGVVDVLIRCAEGDLRRAITYMQSAARLVGAIAPALQNKKRGKAGDDDDDDDAMDVDARGAVVSVSIVEEVAGVIPDSTIEVLVKAMQPRKGPSYEPIAREVEELVADGWSASQMVSQVSSTLVFQAHLSLATLMFPSSTRTRLQLKRLTDMARATALPTNRLRRHDPQQAQEQDRSALLRGGQASCRRCG